MSTDSSTGQFSPHNEDNTDILEQGDYAPLRCWDCNITFTAKEYLYKHLIFHIKQPCVVVDKLQLPPLKVTLRTRGPNSFEIVSSPSQSVTSPLNADNADRQSESTYPKSATPTVKLAEGGATAEPQQRVKAERNEEEEENGTAAGGGSENVTIEELERSVSFSPNLAGGVVSPAPSSPASNAGTRTPNGSEKDNIESNSSCSTTSSNTAADATSATTPEYGGIPGAQPTPPPEPSPDYPKIRIKTTGLLKEPLTITEITDENPTGDPNMAPNNSNNTMWSTPSLEDPLKLPESDDNNILALFNNNDKAKDYGFCSTDSEYISLDRLGEGNRGAMQVYNPQNTVVTSSQNPLDSITGLPMQALAQQVSRLQSTNREGNALHQQNVLINIQQFPSAPQPSYQPPPMYPHHPQAPMYPPYQYQPPSPMYYPPGYPPQPHMPPPMQPQMGQMQPPGNHQPAMGQPMVQSGPPPGHQTGTMGQPPNPMVSQGQNMNNMQQTQQPPAYRPQMQPRQAAPRQPQNMMFYEHSSDSFSEPFVGGSSDEYVLSSQDHSSDYTFVSEKCRKKKKKPAPNPRMPMQPRQPGLPRGSGPTRARVPWMRPRGAAVQTRNPRPRVPGPQNGQQVRPAVATMKRPDAGGPAPQLQPKKKRVDLLTPDKDDEDCQVICMQPKNTDGGLPQIENIQGGKPDSSEGNIMHLSDSITLSVRNPPPKPAEQAKKSDASAVANILATRGITVTATAKPKEKEPSKPVSAAIPSSLNLNGAVSILPAAKTNGNAKVQEALPLVDLTDDTAVSSNPPKPNNASQKQRGGLPYRCDLCPAQYPNAVGLNKHRQSYHKTSAGICDLAIPLINLKQPGIFQKLAGIGINNYIAVSGPNGENLSLPLINTRNPGNMAALGSTQMVTLGPIRAIPKTQNTAAQQNTNQAPQRQNIQKT